MRLGSEPVVDACASAALQLQIRLPSPDLRASACVCALTPHARIRDTTAIQCSICYIHVTRPCPNAISAQLISMCMRTRCASAVSCTIPSGALFRSHIFCVASI